MKAFFKEWWVWWICVVFAMVVFVFVDTKSGPSSQKIVETGDAAFLLDGHLFYSFYFPEHPVNDGVVYHSKDCPCGWRRKK